MKTKPRAKWVLPSREQLSRIVDAANSAPSGDNCQPWYFRYRSGKLEIHHDDVRARHFLNHDGSLSRIALGCLVEALKIGASLEQLRAEVTLSRGEGSEPWATVRFAVAHGEPHPLTEALVRRATDRRPFLRARLPDATRDKIIGNTRGFGDVGVYVLPTPVAELLDYLVHCDTYVLRNADAMPDVVKFLRFTQEEFDQKRDGMLLTSMGLPIPRSPGLALTGLSAVQRAIEHLQLHRIVRSYFLDALQSAAAFVCITVRNMRPETLVEGGRRGFLAWLELTDIGWGVQPLSFSCLPVYQRAAGHRPAAEHSELEQMAAMGEKFLPRHFGYPPNEIPIWMLRTGMATAFPRGSRSLRRKVDDILTIEDG